MEVKTFKISNPRTLMPLLRTKLQKHGIYDQPVFLGSVSEGYETPGTLILIGVPREAQMKLKEDLEGLQAFKRVIFE